MDKLLIKKENQSVLHIKCEQSIGEELKDFFFLLLTVYFLKNFSGISGSLIEKYYLSFFDYDKQNIIKLDSFFIFI